MRVADVDGYVPSGTPPASLFCNCRIVPAVSEAVRPFRLKASPASKLSVWPLTEDTVCRQLPLALLNMTRSPALTGIPALPSRTQPASNVTDVPSAAINPAGHLAPLIGF